MTGRIIEAAREMDARVGEQLSWLSAQERRKLEWVVGEIPIDCAMSRALLGRNSGFWERVFEAIKGGGIPVAWSGRWPDGDLVILAPE